MPLAGKLPLALEILFTYGRVRWAIRRYQLPRVVAMLRSGSYASDRAVPLPDGARDGQRLGAAVVRMLELLPTDSPCLMRSLVLLRLLARRRASASLVIAVQPTGELGLNAHAWVELGGRPLLMPATAEYGRLVTL